MTDFSLSIDRTGMAGDPGPLVLHGDRQPGWCLMPGWQMPSQQARISYASSPYLHGDVATHWTWQQALMSGDVLPVVSDGVTLADLVIELRAAIGRLSFDVTAVFNDLPDETWHCDVGSMSPSPLDYVSISRNEVPYSLTIPCYPLPTGGA